MTTTSILFRTVRKFMYIYHIMILSFIVVSIFNLFVVSYLQIARKNCQQ